MFLRDLVVFLAGAEFFHTLSHIILPYFFSLPIDFKFMVLTPSMNLWIIIISALITIGLLWLACKMRRR